MIRVIDIETTGIDPDSDEILEIASVDMVRGGGITNPMNTPIPPGASAVHHLIDEDVRNAPPLSEVIERSRVPTSMLPTMRRSSKVSSPPGG